MKIQGTLQKLDRGFCLDTTEGKFAIHSITDAPKVSKLPLGTVLHGTIRDYHPKQLEILGWEHQGTVETGQLFIGALKE
jgi:hypothetical protein